MRKECKMDKKNLFWYVTIFMVGIFFFSSLALAQRKQKMEISADIVFTNGKIYTVNKNIAPAIRNQRALTS